MASPLTVYSSTAAGRCYSTNATYLTARSTATIRSKVFAVGQYWDAANYWCQESFMSFDTSSIPDDATITSATLSLYGIATTALATNFTIQVKPRAWDPDGGVPENGPALASWVAGADLAALTTLATFATSGGWSVAAYNVFTSTGDFLSAINKTGDTDLMVCSDRHAAGDTPTNCEFVRGGTFDDAGKIPRLVVEYTTGWTGLTVTRTLNG